MKRADKELTMSEAAAKIGVTRQRMHVIIDTYELSFRWVGPLKIISETELKRLPKLRPGGRRVKAISK